MLQQIILFMMNQFMDVTVYYKPEKILNFVMFYVYMYTRSATI